jgi:protein SDA1
LVRVLQGTKSSKKKKQAKLKRVVHSLKKAARREAAAGNEGFAALHLLHDPQVCGCGLGGREGGGSCCLTVLGLYPSHVGKSVTK